jgi:outer membrane protein assembly factor BamB
MKQVAWGLLFLVGAVTAACADWPEFRGPSGDGRAEGAPQVPLKWSETENIMWKTAIPNIGWSTPVAMDGAIWLTSATEEGNDFFVHRIDAETGKIVFSEELFHCDEPEPLGNSVNCYAAPTAALEKGHVYVHFGSYGTACLDTKTNKTLWKRDDMPCRHYRGPGSSAILHGDLLILTFDGVDQQYMTALNKKTGETVWRTDRTTEWNDLDENGKPKREGDFRKAFSTPIVATIAGKDQLICPASYNVFAYDPQTGKELWKVPHGSFTSQVSPVFANGLLIAATGAGKAEVLGIRPGGEVAWRFGGKDVPSTPSPVATDELVFVVSNGGTINCLDATTGKSLWRERAGGNHIASPILVGDRVYVCSTTGKTKVIRAGRTFELLAENVLDEGLMASPAIMGNALYLRTKTHLYRIGER